MPTYAAATPVTLTIEVSPAAQTITFTGLPATATFGAAGPYTLNATASSGLPVSYTVTGPATINGSTLTITGAGTVAVTASQAGNATYSAATPVSLTIACQPCQPDHYLRCDSRPERGDVGYAQRLGQFRTAGELCLHDHRGVQCQR